MWDLAEDKNSVELIESFLVANTPIALVCRAPGALRPLKTRDGKPLVQGKKVTGFAKGEEAIRSAVRAGMRIFICESREDYESWRNHRDHAAPLVSRAANGAAIGVRN